MTQIQQVTVAGSANHQPQKGAGDPACSRCRGRGRVVSADPLTPAPCPCAARILLQAEIKRCWPPEVIKASPVAESPLAGRLGESLWVRGERGELDANLNRALRSAQKVELVRVATDADLATAWLARASKNEAHDAEENRFETLADLVTPPSLLVLVLGVKSTPLAALPGLVLEAIEMRQQRGRATWVVDTHAKPMRAGHPAHSGDLAGLLAGWPRLDLSPPSQAAAEPIVKAGAEPAPPVCEVVRAWLAGEKITDFDPQGDRGGGAKIDHLGSPGCGQKTVSIFAHRTRGTASGKCSATGCPSGGKVAAAGAFLPAATAKPVGAGASSPWTVERAAQVLQGLLAGRDSILATDGKMALQGASEDTMRRARRKLGVAAAATPAGYVWRHVPQ